MRPGPCCLPLFTSVGGLSTIDRKFGSSAGVCANRRGCACRTPREPGDFREYLWDLSTSHLICRKTEDGDLMLKTMVNQEPQSRSICNLFRETKQKRGQTKRRTELQCGFCPETPHPAASGRVPVQLLAYISTKYLSSMNRS